MKLNPFIDYFFRSNNIPLNSHNIQFLKNATSTDMETFSIRSCIRSVTFPDHTYRVKGFTNEITIFTATTSKGILLFFLLIFVLSYQ
jgi:hypothetical protein